MSRLAQPNGDDYPDAAVKHLEDAFALYHRAQRYDGAAYLAGYVVECTLKTLIVIERGTCNWIHDLNKLSREALMLASLPGARTARYVPKMTKGHSLYNMSGGWKETLRYRAPGAVTKGTTKEWLEEAREVYKSSILPMRLDGVI